MKWSELFTDTVLQRLIAEGITNSPDLLMAYTRIDQAEAYFAQSKAALWPTLNGNAAITESKLSEAQGFGIRTRATQFQIGVASVWEIDIWGKLRSNRRANLASLLQSQAAAKTIQTRLISLIATYYYQLLALDQQLLITEQTVHYWDTTVLTMRALKEASRVTEAAVVQSEAQRYGAEVTIPDIRQSIRETENALSILIGTVPGNVERTALAEQQAPAQLRVGLPAQLLANRPDVYEAEMNFRNAFELTNVAQTQFYPSLSINGSTGFSSLSVNDLFNPASIVASIGAGIVQPIFNQRQNRTRLEVSRAIQQEAFYNFQNSLLIAGQEVSDALSLHQTALEKMEIRSSQIDALENSVEYSHELLQNGFANYTEVINARQFLLQAELGRVNDRLQQLRATVNLYRALGGGWR
jgi:NodT family efflux transporter outer membrane factor (OMF) lipoprotein